jgi:hypothetical protein
MDEGMDEELDGDLNGEMDGEGDGGDVDPETGKGVNVIGILESAGMVIRPSETSETTVGRVLTVNWARVREPLSIMTSINVATVSVTVGAGISRRSMPVLA